MLNISILKRPQRGVKFSPLGKKAAIRDLTLNQAGTNPRRLGAIMADLTKYAS
jgi:hypothetical protein